jgi:hypothetical protein
MTDIAIRVDNLSKLYPEPAARAGHLGALQQRHDTNAPSLSASLPDALTGAFTRRRHNGPAPNDHRSPFLGTGEPGSPITDYHPDDLWTLKDVSFEACPESSRRIQRFLDTPVRAPRLAFAVAAHQEPEILS